jgi:hypothetical protein
MQTLNTSLPSLTILDLPLEIVFHIAYFLDADLNFSLTCQLFHKLNKYHLRVKFERFLKEGHPWLSFAWKHKEYNDFLERSVCTFFCKPSKNDDSCAFHQKRIKDVLSPETRAFLFILITSSREDFVSFLGFFKVFNLEDFELKSILNLTRRTLDVDPDDNPNQLIESFLTFDEEMHINRGNVEFFKEKKEKLINFIVGIHEKNYYPGIEFYLIEDYWLQTCEIVLRFLKGFFCSNILKELTKKDREMIFRRFKVNNGEDDEDSENKLLKKQDKVIREIIWLVKEIEKNHKLIEKETEEETDEETEEIEEINKGKTIKLPGTDINLIMLIINKTKEERSIVS